MCFRCPDTGHRGSPYFPFWRGCPRAFQILVTAPSGLLVTCLTEGPATCKREDNLYLLFQLLWRPLPCESWDFPGGVGRGLGTKENVLLGGGGQEAKKLDRKWVWRAEVYLGYLKGGLSTRRLKKAPCFQFPSPVPRASTGLRRMPLVCRSSVVCHPFKCSHFQVTIFSLALPWAEHVWHTGLTFTP